jgi:hypothetical protein
MDERRADTQVSAPTAHHLRQRATCYRYRAAKEADSAKAAHHREIGQILDREAKNIEQQQNAQHRLPATRWRDGSRFSSGRRLKMGQLLSRGPAIA